MARLRYVKDTSSSGGRASGAAPGTAHTVRSLRARYLTHPEIAAALLPRPLEPASSPEVFVQFAHVAMHLAPERTVEIGAATVGVACSYEGAPGYYVLAMPMEGEFVVIGGREKFGEPKKIAETRFSLAPEGERSRVSAQVSRKGVTFLELDGLVGEESDAPKEFTEHFYCYKAMPACQPERSLNGGFDGEVLLTRLVWRRRYTRVRRVDEGRIVLRESPHDPLVDVPVLRVLSMELAEGSTSTSGEVLRSVPGEWLAPFLVQRYDDPQPGIEIALSAEGDGV